VPTKTADFFLFEQKKSKPKTADVFIMTQKIARWHEIASKQMINRRYKLPVFQKVTSE